MSVFDKLKAYSRKPAAVILATVMATSTIPTTPIAQAVTAAYAAETSTPAKTTSGESAKAEFNPSDVVTTISDWKGDNQELKFSVHVGKDAGYASATISKADIESLLKEHVKKEMASDFVYAPDGTNALSVAINNSLKEQKLDKDCSNPVVRQNEDGTYCVEPSIANVEYKLVSPSAEKIDDKGNVTVKRREGGDVQLEFQITSVTLSAKYNYNVTKTTVVEKPDTGSTGTGTETGGTGSGTGTGETTPGTVSDVTEGEGTPSVPPTETVKIKDPVAVKDVKPSLDGKNVNVTTGKLNFREYYENETASVPAAVTADNLMYKSGKREYTLTLGGKGLTGEVVNNNEKFFAASVSGANESQTLSIDPLKAFNNDEKDKCDPKTVTIKWKYPDGTYTPETTTVTVPNIARKPIAASDISKLIGDQDFRIQSKQEKNVADQTNAALVKLITDFNADDGGKIKDKKYFASATFKNYDSQGASAQNLEVSYTTDNTGIFENYDIEAPAIVRVKALEEISWADDNIVLHSIHNEDNQKIDLKATDHGTWVKQAPTASWKDHSLTAATVVPETADGFKGWTAPETNGEQTQTIFALDNESGVVVKVSVAYKLDTTPVEASSIKYGGARQTRHDNIVFSDKSFSVDYQLAPVPSGINSTDVSYHDNKSNTDVKGLKPSTVGGFLYSFEVSGDRELDTDKIKIHAVSNSGMFLDTTASQIKGKDQISKDVAKLIAESSGPKVAISYSDTNPQRTANGKDYYNHSRTIRITVTDPFFKYTREYAPQTICEVTRDGSNFATVSTGDNWHQGGSSDEWYVDIPVTADGDYVVGKANVYDVIGGDGHTSAADGEEFVIDQTAPKLNVSWNTEAAQNGKYYNAARTATITVEEHNFDPNLFKIEAPVSAGNGDEATPAQIGGWTSNGDTHTATVTFPGQGVYTLSVSGEDLASNKSESYTSPEFVIDTIKPKIDIQNVVNRTAYAGEVAPSAAVHDTNLADGTTIEVSKISYPLSKDDPNPYAGAAINTSATDKSVSYLNPAKTKGNDGVYTLTVQAIDLAGNTESEAVTWSVNRFGSTYVISDNTGKMLDQYLKSSKTTDVKVTEINPSGLDDNKTSVELTRDTKNTTLKSGDNYTTDSDTSSGWSEYNYTVSKSNYDKDGAYRVLFHSEDAAGNSSENTMEGKNAKKTGAAAEINFAVDDTAPIASFVDLASNGKYEESSHKAKVSFEDNLKLSKAQVKVNGKTVATFTADQLEKSPIREFTLDGSSSKQDVTVVAWDAAGNKSKELKATGVLVTNDSFVLWMNNLPLMIGTIVAIVVVAGGIYLVVAKKRKENEEN